jgi:DNA-binding winged helix-turn-helix (wHTH) protein/Tol biopolymer transport system component
MVPAPRTVLRFGSYELDLRARELRKDGVNTGLPEQSVKILEMLLAHEGDVVLRDEMRSRLWPDGIVVEFDHSINAAVKRLRQALGDSAERPQFIETLPRRGYRWIKSADHPVVRYETGKGGPTAIADSYSEPNRAGQPTQPSARREFAMRPPRNWLSAIATIGLAASSFFVFASRRPVEPPSRREIKQRQITSNPTDDSAKSGSISADGKYLAYADSKGIHIRDLGTSVAAQVPQPADLPGSASWYVGPWFPNGRGFLANAQAAGITPPFDAWSSPDTSIWIVPSFGGRPRKLRDHAIGYSVSPDGAWVAFGTSSGRYGDREIWVVGPDGSGARKVVESGDDGALSSFVWSPNGRRIAYLAMDRSGTKILTRDWREGTKETTVLSAPESEFLDLVWPSESRLLYSRAEPGSIGTCNLWEARIDPGNGRPAEPPRRITNWVGSCLRGMNSTANGERVAFAKWDAHFTVLLADHKPGSTGVVSHRRLTTTQSVDFPSDWTLDSRFVIVWSNRSGRFAPYRQPVNGDAAEPLVFGNRDYGFPRVTPDGSWVLFDDPMMTLETPVPGRTVRVPITGGEPQFVSPSYPDDQILCAKSPASICIVKQLSSDRTQAIFRYFEPTTGPSAELLRLPVENDKYFGWDLARDGSKLAVCRSPRGPVQILSLDGKVLREIQSEQLDNMRSLDWAADGRGLYIANTGPQKVDLYYVDMDGRTERIWSQRGSQGTFALESPDKRYLALSAFTVDTNVWSLEDF